MMGTVRKTTTAFAAIATAGVSSIFMGATPAFAVPDACGPSGVVVGPGICEQIFTGDDTFTPTADMTKLEVLLVGSGGDGNYAVTSDDPATVGYAAAGGGGAVTIVDFSGSTDPIALTIGASGDSGGSTGADNGTTSGSAANGESGEGSGDPADGYADGGASGNGNSGGSASDPDPLAAGGGGAGDTPTTTAGGGAGAVVSDVAPGGSLFSSDSRCFGGGGAAGLSGIKGVPGCGGGGPTDATGTATFAVTPNSGGGGGSVAADQDSETAQYGADGVAIVRWNAPDITLGFVTNGHGVTPAIQTFPAGNPGTKPTDPTADGFTFKGWFTDSGLTHPVNFASAIPVSTIFYAKWAPALAATGGVLNAVVAPIGLATILAGLALFLMGRRRKPQAD